ncbi:MAG: DUF2971 domain-containing protein [Bradyrhizobium sp.]
MPSIFHYTDTAGAVGILNSQSLFASDFRYLNDSSEGTVIDSLLRPILQDEVAIASKELVAAGFVRPEYYKDLGSNADQLQVEALFRSIITATDNVSPRFVVSFCRHKEGSEQFEHGLLSQWRGYADRGGFAFEFDEDGLDQLIKSECEKYFFGPVAWRDVVYNDFDTLFIKKDYEGLARAMIGKVFLDPKVTKISNLAARKKIAEIAGEKDIDEAIANYLSTAPFLKHFGFHEEREYRIAISCVRENKLPKDAKSPAKPVDFRTRNSLIIPFIRLFGDGAKLPIKSIIVGPHVHQNLQKDAVERLLEQKRIAARVRLSSIPFRG